MTNDTPTPSVVTDDPTDNPARTRVRARAGGGAAEPDPDSQQETGQEPAYTKRRTRPRNDAPRRRTPAPPAVEEIPAEEPAPVLGLVEVPGALDEPEVDVVAEPE